MGGCGALQGQVRQPVGFACQDLLVPEGIAGHMELLPHPVHIPRPVDHGGAVHRLVAGRCPVAYQPLGFDSLLRSGAILQTFFKVGFWSTNRTSAV